MLTETFLDLVLLMLAIGSGLAWGWFAWVSRQEGERRAMRLALGLAVGLGGFFLIATYFAFNVRLVIFYVLIIILLTGLGLFLLPLGSLPAETALPTRRFDERQIMFARHRLQPGTPEYKSYYAEHPAHKKADDRTRARPGLLSPAASMPIPQPLPLPMPDFRSPRHYTRW